MQARRILILISDGDVDTGAIEVKQQMESKDNVVVFSTWAVTDGLAMLHRC